MQYVGIIMMECAPKHQPAEYPIWMIKLYTESMGFVFLLEKNKAGEEILKYFKNHLEVV